MKIVEYKGRFILGEGLKIKVKGEPVIRLFYDRGKQFVAVFDVYEIGESKSECELKKKDSFR